MICPKCGNDMEAIEFEGVEVDRYRCPRCAGGMLRRVDPKQTHIRYEECTSCRGTFFDAGEFTDLIKDTISELLKRRPEQKGP